MLRIAHNLIKILIAISLSSVSASPFTHEFSNPSFNGNAGTHWLSIEEKLLKKKEMYKDRERAKVEKELALANKSNLKKFFANVEARIYANLSKQLVDNMFGEDSSTSGTVTIEGNSITYLKTGDSIILTVVNEDGTTTEMTLPVNSFTF